MSTTRTLDDLTAVGIIQLDAAELARVNGGELPWWGKLLLKAGEEILDNWGAFKEGLSAGYDSVANNPS